VTQKHSPEPWKARKNAFGDYLIADSRGSPVIGGGTDDAYSADREDAERIVACVNFCRQFPTAWLQGRQLVRIDDASQLVHKSLADIEGFDGLVACKLIPVARNPT
jgi:hypothetical protein